MKPYIYVHTYRVTDMHKHKRLHFGSTTTIYVA